MKNFFINFWKVMMHSSFIMTAIFLIIFSSSLEISGLKDGLSYESTPKYNSSIPVHDSIEFIVNEIFDSLNIDLEPTQTQIFVVLIVLSLLFGFISRLILKKIEYQQYH